ncbi:MAG: hypothetical protein JNL05_14135 [Flavobacteriales bacterium]|nr:hypothetical protein [Flavobacteriales bacterium]
MKRRTASLVALLLYVMVQAVAALPVQWRMDCLMSDRSMLSWGSARTCMPVQEAGDESTLDVQCCLFSYVLGAREIQVKSGPAVEVAVVDAVPAPVAAPVHVPSGPARTAICDHPPPDTRLAVVRLRALRL